MKSTPRRKTVVKQTSAQHISFELVQHACAFAARSHRHQMRKDERTPYFSHVARVALTTVSVFGCNDAIVMATALLHDTIEDTTTDFEDIADRFGFEVANNVAALTKNMALPEAEREASYDAQLIGASWQVKLIKLADVYDNLHDVEGFPEARRAKAKGEAIDKCRRAIAIARSKPTNQVVLAAADLVEQFMLGV